MKKNGNKGLTLIELLAVITLMFVISSITYFSINISIDNSKDKLFDQQIRVLEQSGHNWVAANSGIVDNAFDEEGNCASSLCFTSNGKNYYKLLYSQLYDSGFIKSNYLKNPKNDQKMPGCIGIYYDKDINQYVVNYVENCVSLVNEIDDTQKSNGKSIKVVYMDPTDLTNPCNASNSVSTTETNSGCMKWYAYKEEDGFYKMILDHNTTARLGFNNSSNMIYQINARLAFDTKKWQVDSNNEIMIKKVDLITKEEFDMATQPSISESDNETSEPTISQYAWLYNYTYACDSDPTDTIKYVCAANDNQEYELYILQNSKNNKFVQGNDLNHSYGYWTGSILDSSNVWFVDKGGSIQTFGADIVGYGIRPVVTISSLLLQNINN